MRGEASRDAATAKWGHAIRARTPDMIEVMIVVGVVALLGAALIRPAWIPGRREATNTTQPTRDDADFWLARAAELTQTGHQLLDEIDPIVEADSASRSNDSLSSLAAQHLDVFTHNLAELGASAPTTMDNRVCRGVAVKSHGLSEALRPRSRESDAPGPTADREAASDLQDRFAEFSRALGDLAEHVHLL